MLGLLILHSMGRFLYSIRVIFNIRIELFYSTFKIKINIVTYCIFQLETIL